MEWEAELVGVEDLVRSVLRADGPLDGGDEDRRVAAEMTLYAAAPESARRTAAARLRAIAGLPHRSRRTKASIMAACEAIGVRQSNLYRLLKRVDALGPVAGLLPGHREAARPSMAADGFGGPVDGWIEDLLRDRPDATIVEARGYVARMAADAGGDVRLPTADALLRRLHALRALRKVSGEALANVGRTVVIDQCEVSLVVGPKDGPGRRVTAVYVIDAATSLVLGTGMFLGGPARVGLAAALHDVGRRGTEALIDFGVELHTWPSKLVWLVPDELVHVRELVVSAARARGDAPLEIADPDGGRRPGAEIYRLLGARMGPFRFVQRGGPDGRADAIEAGGRTSAEASDTADAQYALELLRREARARNQALLTGLGLRRVESFEAWLSETRAWSYGDGLRSIFLGALTADAAGGQAAPKTKRSGLDRG